MDCLIMLIQSKMDAICYPKQDNGCQQSLSIELTIHIHTKYILVFPV